MMENNLLGISLSKTLANFDMAERRIKNATSLHDIVAGMAVHIGITVRHDPAIKRRKNAIAHVAHDAATVIIEQQLGELKQCSSVGEFIKAAGPLRVQWQILTPYLPRAYELATKGAQRLQHKLQKAANLSGQPVDSSEAEKAMRISRTPGSKP